MRLKTIKKLVRLVEESEIECLSVNSWFYGIKIVKGEGKKNNLTSSKGKFVVDLFSKSDDDKYYLLKAGDVGTFYWNDSKSDLHSVERDNFYMEGKILGYIRGIGVFQEIVLDKSGIVRRIYVENEIPVEFGQALFGIEANDLRNT